MAFDPTNHSFPETDDWSLPQGSDWSYLITISGENDVAEDLTGWAARAMFRRKREDATPVLSRTTADGTIVLGGALGTVELIFADTDTDGIRKFNEDGEIDLFYDLELVSPLGLVARILEGTCTLTRNMTRGA